MNQRASTASAIDAVPPFFTASMRAAQMSAGSFGDVFDSTSLSRRSPAFAPIHCPTMPPIEMPAKLKRVTPAASATASASRPSISIV